MANTTSSSSGIGFFGLLYIVFITLKLLDVIDWSWWWILAPVWIPLAIVFLIIAAIGGAALIGAAADTRKKRARRIKP